MPRRYGLALAALVVGVLILLGGTPVVHSQRPPLDRKPAGPAGADAANDAGGGLVQRLAKAANIKDAEAARVLSVLGPILSEELTRGGTVSLSGLGSFRIAQTASHRDMRGGSRGGAPFTVPTTNTVEFIADGSLAEAASSAAATPAVKVPAFEYIPIPGQTPGQKTMPGRVPSIRTP